MYNYGHYAFTAEYMDLMPDLRVISNYGVGVDHIDLQAAQERGIPVGNTPKILDGATADITFALLLAAARNLIQGDHFARGPDFVAYDPSFMLGQEVHHQVLGIIGLGSIGYQVARRALAFDMTVLYHNRNPNPKAEADLGARYVGLDELLQQADFVTLNMPLTDQTRGMIGQRELGLMKKSAVLVNAARGGRRRSRRAGRNPAKPRDLRSRPRRNRTRTPPPRPPPPRAGQPRHHTPSRQRNAPDSPSHGRAVGGQPAAGLEGRELLSRIV